MAVDYEFPQCESVLATARHDPLTYQKLEIVLCDSNVHMTHRIRALFTLKAFKTEKAVEVIGKAFKDTSALLKHELAYVLGQMQLPCAIPILSARLEDLHEDPMVRHEAGEALGAIGEVSVLPLLKKYNSPELEKHPEVYQTCELAIELLNSRPHTPQWVSSNPNTSTRTYASIDPAPPFDLDDYTIAELHAILLNPKVSLFQRYRAMFTLRDIGSEEAVLMLKDGFKDTSALFRHEIGNCDSWFILLFSFYH
ncbi:hypothetical protein HMI55_004380 [Coelomomyces lativittatus]|nr:hypothetical protein HMI55_004380 [Coelomomyces lativittatus]